MYQARKEAFFFKAYTDKPHYPTLSANGENILYLVNQRGRHLSATVWHSGKQESSKLFCFGNTKTKSGTNH